jgi:hypothetical protein
MALGDALTGLEPAGRKEALERTHPLYADFESAWRILLDALEGTGGFLSGDYLWKYPREIKEDFEKRREQARYHNYAKTLVNIYVRYVFHGGVKRTTSDAELEAWWGDVDGSGTKVNDFMKRVVRIALAISHAAILVDKENIQPVGPSKADDLGRVLALVHAPLSILDWRTERNGVTLKFVKLRECINDDDPLGKPEEEEYSYLLWTMDEWARFDYEGELINRGNHDLECVPLVVLRPEQSSQYPFLGQALFGNANVLRAIFNRCSEEDEVLRNSSFSMLGVSIGENAPEGAVGKAKEQIGNDVGTTRAIVVQGTIDYKTPDQSVPGAIRENIQFLIQEVYRMAHVVYQRDSRDAETAEAIKLKHNELQEMLVGLAEENERVEMELARLFFAWKEPTVEAADARLKAANVVTQYPREFFVADMMAELEKWAKAVALDLGETMTKTIKKQAARALVPAMDEDTQKKVDGEIDKQVAAPAMVPFAPRPFGGFGGRPGPQAVPKPGEPKPGEPAVA